VTEIYDICVCCTPESAYLIVRIAIKETRPQTIDQIIDSILEAGTGYKAADFAPCFRPERGAPKNFESAAKSRLCGSEWMEILDLSESIPLG
jgi:hypothetical protein